MSDSLQSGFLSGALHAATFIKPIDWLAFAAEAERVFEFEQDAPLSMALFGASELYGHEDPRGIALRAFLYENTYFPRA